MTNTAVAKLPSELPRLVVYLPPDLKDELAKLAAQERRSLSQMAVIAIENEIKRVKQENHPESPSSGQ